MPSHPRSPRRTFAKVAGLLVALFLVWLFFAYQLFFNVQNQPVERADAVVMLGGASKERLLDAMMIREEISAPYLVLSTTDTPGNASADAYCDSHSNKEIYPDVICFMPSSMDTRGEADVVGLLAAEHGWESVVVVTSKYHVVRSERLMRQCVPAEIQMVATDPQLSPAKWLRRLVIETGGLLTVFLNPECDSPIRGVPAH